MMTQPNLFLKPLLLNTISHGALDYVYAPKMFELRIAVGYGESVADGYLSLAPSLKTPLTILAWMQMWLRLVLGLETGRESVRCSVGTYPVSAISYHQVKPEALNKAPAHNLEALMRFAPDRVGEGLTLNQYRERFTRLSVLGRIKIYRALAILHVSGLSRMLRALSVMRATRPALCHAPLRPD